MRVFRRINKRYAQCNIKHGFPFDSASVMVWESITSTAHKLITLQILNSVLLTSSRYITKILGHAIPFVVDDFIGDDFILIDT